MPYPAWPAGESKGSGGAAERERCEGIRVKRNRGDDRSPVIGAQSDRAGLPPPKFGA